MSDSTASDYKDKEREHRKMKKRLAELDKLFAALYEDKVMKKITERNYELMSKRYELEQLELEKQISKIGAIITSKGLYAPQAPISKKLAPKIERLAKRGKKLAKPRLCNLAISKREVT